MKAVLLAVIGAVAALWATVALLGVELVAPAPPMGIYARYLCPPGPKTIWDLNSDGMVTGPHPMLMRLLSSLPFGDLFRRQEMVDAEFETEDVGFGLSWGGIPPEQVAYIRDALQPRWWSNQQSYAAIMEGLDDGLADSWTTAAANCSDCGAAYRDHARTAALTLSEFRRCTLGVPPRLTPTQIAAAPHGFVYRNVVFRDFSTFDNVQVKP